LTEVEVVVDGFKVEDSFEVFQVNLIIFKIEILK
jgi:hypothetical protein